MNLILDLGNVVLDWDPAGFIHRLPFETATRRAIAREIFDHSDWLAMDGGLKTETELIERITLTTDLAESQLRAALLAARHALVEIPETIVLMRELKQRGVPMYCLSNMSVENYEFIRRREFFSLFDGIVISGIEKAVKPGQKIFELLVDRFDLEVGQTLFVDDMPENINAAEQFGIRGILFDRSADSYRRIRQSLLKNP